jgi:hypothetical protein
MELKRKTEDEIEAIVRQAVDDAISFKESEIDPDRDKAQRYYNGQVDIQADEGRSKVIATKCRDVVRQVKPSIKRVFFSSDKPGEFIARNPQDVLGAEQATRYVEYKLDQNHGYNVLSNAFHDALVKKVGIVKAFYEEKEEVDYDEYTGLTDAQLALVASDENAEIVEHSQEVQAEVGPDGVEVEVSLHDVKVAYRRDDGDIKLSSVPPEDFFVDNQASNLEDFYVVGHKTDMRVGDLVAMGFDFDEVHDLGADIDIDDEADFSRRGYEDDNTDDNALDPSLRPVTVYEAYMHMDIEGTGIPRLYSFILAGAKRQMLDFTPCDFVPFAIFEIDPEPHTFFGASLVDILINDQDAMTAMWRGLIDNVNITNNPGMAYDDTQVNTDDMLNNEIGKLVRTKGSPGNHIMPFAVPFTAGQTIPAMEYYDQMLQDKTGVNRTSMGLDPDSLQNTTATAVNAAVGAAEGQIEDMARNLAEGGLTQLYKLLYQLARQHADGEEIIIMDGQYIPIDPRSWTADAMVKVNVGLGRQTLQNQTAIYQTYGPSNGIVTLTQLRNTLADIQKIGGVHNNERYYMPMTPELEQLLQQQAQMAAQQAAQSAPDPNEAFLQAEMIKAQSKQQTDMMKIQVDAQQAQAQEQRERAEMGLKDDLERDKMVQELAIEVARILGEYGTSVDVAAVTAAQNAPREVL